MLLVFHADFFWSAPKNEMGRLCQPYLLQGSLDVNSLAPGHSWVSQTVPGISPSGYVNPLPPQALEGLSHHLHTIVGESGCVLGKGRQTGRHQRELTERWDGGCVEEWLPGREKYVVGQWIGAMVRNVISLIGLSSQWPLQSCKFSMASCNL